MKKATVEEQATQRIEGILSAKWTVRQLTDAYISSVAPQFDDWKDVDLYVIDTKKRLGEKTVKELEGNYDARTIGRICMALNYFSFLLHGPAVDFLSHKKDILKSRQYFRKQYQKIVKAADMMLEKRSELNGVKLAPFLTEAEERTILQIKARYQNYLNPLLNRDEKKTVDPFQNALLGFLVESNPSDVAAGTGLAGVPFILTPTDPKEAKEWKKEVFRQMPFLIKPSTGAAAKKTVESALRTVIFRLLENDDISKKHREILTAEILIDYFPNKKTTAKQVNIALHNP